MAGIVISKIGTGGITLNIPLQFDSIDHLTKVITDGITAATASEALKLPETLKTLASDISGSFSALPEVVSSDVLSSISDAHSAINDATSGLMSEIDSAMDVVQNTINTSMLQLDAIANAGTFAAAQAAMSSAGTYPNLLMGGVLPAVANLQRFQQITQTMHPEGQMGGAIQQMNSIAKGAGAISAMSKLAGAIATDLGLPAPPDINDAFDLLQDGDVFNKTQSIAAGMKGVKAVLDIAHASGRLDDLNDAIFQETPSLVTAAAGTYAGQQVMQIGLQQAALNGYIPTDGEVGKLNIPGWVNPNTGLTEYLPAGTSILDSLTGIENDLLSKTSAIKAAVESSLKPIEDLANAIGLAASSASLPAALGSSLSGAVKSAMSSAALDTLGAAADLPPPIPAGASAEEGGSGLPK